jgi:hypothetical protein
MILNNFIEIKITKKNIDHFINFYKNIKLKDIIKVKPEQLQNNSNSRIDVKCEICGIERNIKYQAYYKNINSCEDYPIYTCDKCSHVKIKSYNRKKWGVDYFSQTSDYTDKFKKTMKEKWGVEYAQQSDIIREKTKKTNLEKFGVENPFFDNDMIRSKFKEKWGVDHPSKLKEINDKIKSTKEKNNTSLSSPEVRKKIKETNNLRYGANTNQSNILRNNNITNDSNHIKYINEGVSEFRCDLNKNHIFYINSSNYHNRKRSKLPLCTICNPIGDSQSIKEKELFEFIKSIYNNEIIQSYRDGLEIDIYLPDLKIGFEFNGLYWHSEEWKDKWYHINKTNYFKERGIRIIHIWEDDWDNKTEIIKSQIKNWLGLTESKIFARKCYVKEIVDSKISTKFLEENHIQGKVNSNLKLGLYYGKELMSVMTFDHYEGRNKMESGGWNINRFCNKINHSVVGGASKLFNYFIKNYHVSRVISYSDSDWSSGDLYQNLGFNKINEGNPDYKYIFEDVRVHKSRFRKSRLNSNLTESEYMKKSHIFKIWDCGKIKWLFIQDKI